MRLSKTTTKKLASFGLKAIPSRVRDPDDYRYGGFMIVDQASRVAVWGSYPLPYSLSAKDVHKISAELI